MELKLIISKSFLYSLELIYGGFWEHAHYSFNPTQEEEQDTLEKDRTGHNRRHVFALTLMFLAKGRGDFPELVKCVDDIGSQWEDQRKVQSEDEDKRKPFRFLKHIYYEVRHILINRYS